MNIRYPIYEGVYRILTARLIIAETERKVHYGTERKKRIAAPSGAVILF